MLGSLLVFKVVGTGVKQLDALLFIRATATWFFLMGCGWHAGLNARSLSDDLYGAQFGLWEDLFLYWVQLILLFKLEYVWGQVLDSLLFYHSLIKVLCCKFIMWDVFVFTLHGLESRLNLTWCSKESLFAFPFTFYFAKSFQLKVLWQLDSEFLVTVLIFLQDGSVLLEFLIGKWVGDFRFSIRY